MPVNTAVQLFGLRHDRVIDLVVGGKPRHVRTGIVLGEHTDDHDLILVLILQLDEIGNLGTARRAPGGPEVENHDLSREVLGRDRLAVERRHREIGNLPRVLHEADARLPCRGVVVGRRRDLITHPARVANGQKPADRQRQDQERAQKGLSVHRHLTMPTAGRLRAPPPPRAGPA